jgi:hypothetical protein
VLITVAGVLGQLTLGLLEPLRLTLAGLGQRTMGLVGSILVDQRGLGAHPAADRACVDAGRLGLLSLELGLFDLGLTICVWVTHQGEATHDGRGQTPWLSPTGGGSGSSMAPGSQSTVAAPR